MKYYILVLSLFISSILVGQTQLEAFISPTLTNDIYQTPTSQSSKVDSKYNFGFDVGLGFRNYFNKRMTLGCGINYSKMGYGFDIELNGINRSYNLERYFWEVPVLFDVFIGNKRKIAFNLNLIYQFFIKENSNFDEYVYGTDSPTDITRKLNLAIQSGFTYQLDIYKMFKIRLNPFIKMALPSQQIDYTTSGYPVYRQDWSIGLKTSMVLDIIN
ncbi:outer membrane beta-barrel protein [Saccharicrinis sp. FJH54]|uniref:outer membrane beta-barrel protein n=1 Tax=Saccharicrinis sp. FJH54 TaxID=3344665 RepID=UPI0035D44E7B